MLSVHVLTHSSVMSRAPLGAVFRYVHKSEIVEVVKAATTNHAYKHYRYNICHFI